MIQDKTIARVVGLLFLTTTLAGMIDSYMAMPLLNTSMSHILANRTTILLGVFLTLYMSLGVVGIALMLQPILKRQNELVASMYLSFRIIECVLLLVGAIVPLFLVALSQVVMNGGNDGMALIQSLGSLPMKVRMASFQIAMIILGLNSVVLCTFFFRTRILPRWLSLVGGVGYALLFLSAVLDLCGVIDTAGSGGLLYAPGGVFELILLPIWLIAKGFKAPKT